MKTLKAAFPKLVGPIINKPDKQADTTKPAKPKPVKKKKAKVVKGKKPPVVKRPTLAPPNKVIKIKKPKKLVVKTDELKGKLCKFEAVGDQPQGTSLGGFDYPPNAIDLPAPSKPTFWQQVKYYFGKLKP